MAPIALSDSQMTQVMGTERGAAGRCSRLVRSPSDCDAPARVVQPYARAAR